MPSHPSRRLPAALLLAALAVLPAAARAADLDRDGLDDALEDALLARFAPVVVLAPDERVRPASAPWLLARAALETAPGPPPRVLQASALGALAALLIPGTEEPGARLRLDAAAQAGSPDPADWTAYGHAYRAADGGILLQYWFLYPFNEAFWAFDHDGDWEHMTVRLDAAGRPLGAWLARHADAQPGPWFGWSALRREGEHPVVLSARGTHASYASPDDAPRWERLCPEAEPARAAAAGCPLWRPGAPGFGGVVNMGERGAARVAFLAWPGRWGATGAFGRDSRGAPPPGPAFQRGWCSEGAPGACP
ncbi:hypothetical protein [Anaeromyxobacter sp. PSR-1]|uniref:hypothetical protein n=1 Tax=Anaeromyxobacter sp. PSR-1 TaxID=1300915 RepID=UPI0005E799DE|nr:hypothetical protein [Anaeromyxobacter sp. PSR-1]GAO03929.1 hypothetical protein PSR1_02817 [Anaeromyxobacter sp. PSR-1]